MENSTIEKQARMYLFDLMNAALENGFKADDSWELILGTEAQKTTIQKDYYPAVATKVFPEMVLPVFYTIKSRLKLALNQEEKSLDEKAIIKDQLNYLIAFNSKRQRR